MSFSRLLLASLLLMSSLGAVAQTSRCECTYDKWKGDCTANVSVTGKWAKVTSSHQQCSRVDWYLNGTPTVTVVTDGAETVEILFDGDKKDIAVQSCKICTDHMLTDTASPAAEAPPTQPSVDLNGRWAVFHRSQCDGSTWNWTLNITQTGATLAGVDSPPFPFKKSRFYGEIGTGGEVVLRQQSAPMPGVPANSTMTGSISADGNQITGTRKGSGCGIDFVMTRK